MNAFPSTISTFAYLNDALGRRVEVTRSGLAFGDLAGVTDAYGYNLRSEVVSSRRTTGYTLNPDNPVNPVPNICYSYDAFGRFSSVEFDSNAEPQSRRVEYGYLPDTDLVYGYTSGNFSRSVAYEPQRDLIAAVTNTFSASLISAFDYSNDAAGRRVSRLDSFDGETTANTFGYNARSEVVSAQFPRNRNLVLWSFNKMINHEDV